MEINVYLLYCSVIFIAYFFAIRAKGKTKSIGGVILKEEFHNIYFLASFLVLSFFCVFTNTGVDYINYYNIIDTITSISDVEYYRNVEPLFTIWSYFGKLLFNDVHLVIVSMKVVTLVIMFFSFYILRDKIDVFFAVCAYVSIAYLVSFTLISIVLASSFVTLAFALLMKKGRVIYVVLLMLIGIGIHFACIMPLLAIITYYLMFRYGKGKKHRTTILFVILFLIIFMLPQTPTLMNLIISSTESFDHYQKYVDDLRASSSLGTYAVLFGSYAFIFYLLNKIKKYERDNSLYFLMLVFVLFGFVFEFIGNRIPVMERVVYSYIAVYCLVIPYCLQKLRTVLNANEARMLNIIVFMFFVVRFYFVIRARVMPDSPSQLYYYNFFNPFQ